MRQVKPAQIIKLSPILGFSLVIFFITLSDGIMSYMAPVLVEKHLNDTVLVGIVLSISSFIGMTIDLVVAEKYSRKSFKYFLTKALFIAALFPISFLLFPSSFLSFSISMLIWSIYYEFIGFSKYSFVEKHVQLRDHTNAWGTLVTFSSMAYMIGPGIAVLLIGRFTDLPLYAALVLVGISTFLYILLEKTAGRRKIDRSLSLPQKRNLLCELGVLKTLLKKLWLLVLFSATTTLMDVLIWTIGVLYTEELRKTSPMGDWLLVIYGLPSLFAGFLTEKLRLDAGKKRTAFTASAIAGLCLVFSGLGNYVPAILMFVFFMSTLYCVSVILIDSTFQDYIARAHVVGNDIVSILQFAHNLSYALGPILLGISAKYFGYSRTFQLVGLLVIVVSAISFLAIPRKIKMPQKELKNEISNMKDIPNRARAL